MHLPVPEHPGREAGVLEMSGLQPAAQRVEEAAPCVAVAQLLLSCCWPPYRRSRSRKRAAHRQLPEESRARRVREASLTYSLQYNIVAVRVVRPQDPGANSVGLLPERTELKLVPFVRVRTVGQRKVRPSLALLLCLFPRSTPRSTPSLYIYIISVARSCC